MDTCMKVEASPAKRVFSFVEANGPRENNTKCLKRRCRSPPLLTIGYSKNQQPPVFQIDQTAPTTTTTTTITSTVKRRSRFRGVSRHKWTGRYEAHLWDKASWNATQKKKGKQVYLGAYDEEESAARAYDLAAIKYWGTSTFTNFPISNYDQEVEIMPNVTKEEYLASLRRKSSGFARGVSKYRGVARHHHNGRWEARIGRVFGNKYLYLGTYGTQEEAAHAYDRAAIEYRGINAVTNFDLSSYIRWLKPGNNNNSSSPGFQGLTLQNETLQANYLNLFSKDQELSSSANFLAVKNPAVSQKQEIIERKMPFSPYNKDSSPTALGLLLRSSMFKDLVEKTNSTITANDQTKELERSHSNGEDKFVFCTGNDQEKRFPETDAYPLWNQTGQNFWNPMPYAS